MTELPGSAAIGIEAVEWISEGGGNLVIRITGRWRRRRPASGGQATLVIEAEGRRHRFPALPEPPSLTGASPGMWQLRFSVPGSLAPDLGGRTWLQFGTVIVPLPAAVSSPGEPGPVEAEAASVAAAPPEAVTPPEAAAPADAAARQAPAPASEPPPGPEASSRAADLERELEEARAGADELKALIADRDRARRAAEQRAHAEQALRRDLARQLAASVREADRTRQAMGELAAAEHRIRSLEQELRDARRRSDEAEQAVAAAQVARERAEGQKAASRDRLEASEAQRLALEQGLLQRRAGSGARIPAEPIAPAWSPPPALPAPSAVPAPPVVAAPGARPAPTTLPESGSDPLVDTLRRELDARAAADAGLRSRLVEAEARLAARVLLDQRTTTLLGQLRGELEGLRDAFAQERSQRVGAERHAADLSAQVAQLRGRVNELEQELGGQQERNLHAREAIGELRDALERLREPAPETSQAPAAESALAPGSDAPSPAEAPADPAGPVEPARLNDALARLRQSAAPQAADAVAAAGPDGAQAISRPPLRPVFERLVRADPDAAGRLLMELLPLQRDAYPLAVSYDLMLGADRGCVCVTVLGSAPTISLQSAPRPREAVDFQVFGVPAGIARLVVAGRLRRRLGWKVAKVRGRRERLAALDALLQTPLDLAALHQAGVRLDPEAALELVSAMVPAAWTSHERFTLEHRVPNGESTYLQVSDGRSITVTGRAPEGRISTTIVSGADDLLPILAGESGASEHVEGDLGPLTALHGWINRAQSG